MPEAARRPCRADPAVERAAVGADPAGRGTRPGRGAAENRAQTRRAGRDRTATAIPADGLAPNTRGRPARHLASGEVAGILARARGAGNELAAEPPAGGDHPSAAEGEVVAGRPPVVATHRPD